MADLELPQSGGDTRYKSPVVVNRFRLELLFCVLGEPPLYQIIHLHRCFKRNAVAHFLLKCVRLPFQFPFQLLPGHSRRRCIGAVYQHLTACPIIAIGNPDAVGTGAVFLHPLCYLCHVSTPFSAVPPGFIRPPCRRSHGRTRADTGPLSVQR